MTDIEREKVFRATVSLGQLLVIASLVVSIVTVGIGIGQSWRDMTDQLVGLRSDLTRETEERVKQQTKETEDRVRAQSDVASQINAFSQQLTTIQQQLYTIQLQIHEPSITPLPYGKERTNTK